MLALWDRSVLDTGHMAKNREPSMVSQGFNQMRLEIMEPRAILERNGFNGLPTDP